MTARLSSGQPRLDAILHGGLPANAINLIIGAPGSGKTILTEQYIFHNATLDRPALYLSTVSEPFDKVIRYGQSLEFFDAKAIGKRVLYEDLGVVLRDHGLPGVLSQIDDLIKEHHPGLVAIDSFKALRAFAADETEFRRFLHDLAGRLTAMAEKFDVIGDVRGRGAMIAIELVKDRATKEPNPEATAALAKACHQEGLLVLTCGTYGNVLRFLPPLVIGEDLLNEGLDIIEQAFARI